MIAKELYENLGKLLRFIRQAPPGGAGGKRGAQNNAQVRVLQFLYESNMPKTTGEIAEKLEIRQQSASELVSKLEKKLLISKTKDAADKRITLVSLTESGRDFASQLTQHDEEFYGQFFDSLTPDEQVELNRLVKKLFDSKSEAYKRESGGGLFGAMRKREIAKKDLMGKEI
ncbi:MarR family winged helix-turn-helix transcriptional regulator [Lactococcus insecticola]|nr:MarR family transcriptional regulator [Lactococcus insecticola]